MTAREKEELDEFITQGSFKDYIMDMEKNGSYADHIMVEAMSKLLKVSIQIIMSTGDVIIGPGFDKRSNLVISQSFNITLPSKPNRMKLTQITSGY